MYGFSQRHIQRRLNCVQGNHVNQTIVQGNTIHDNANAGFY